MFTPIDFNTWPRREMFYYFSKMAPTGYSLTVSMDVTKLRKQGLFLPQCGSGENGGKGWNMADAPVHDLPSRHHRRLACPSIFGKLAETYG